MALLPFGSIIAQTCAYELNEIDKFTNEKKVITQPLIVAKKIKIPRAMKVDKLDWKVKLDNNKYKLITTYKLASGGFLMRGNEKLICLLDNKEKVVLPIVSYKALWKVRKGKVISAYEYTISADQLDQLRQHNIESVRVEAYSNGIDFDVLEESPTKDMFNCISNI